MKITANYEKQTLKGIEIELTKTEWGYYISTSDGYQSDYFKFKKEAKQRIQQIKADINSGTW
jgi:hypothetical protein